MPTRTLQLDLRLNTEAAKKQLNDLTVATQKSLAGNSGAGGSAANFAKQNQALDQMKQRFDLLVGAQAKLTQQGQGQSTAYAKISQEIAGIISKQKQWTTSEEQFLALLKSETAEREKAAAVTSKMKPGGGAGGGSSFRQGGTQILGAAGLPGGGLIGATGPLGAFTAALSSASQFVDEYGKKAQELSKTVSDGRGPLDQLRDSSLKLKQAQDRLIDSPAIAAVQKFKNELETAGLEFLQGVIEGLVEGASKFGDFVDHLPGLGRSDEDRKKDSEADAAKKAQSGTKLIGESKVEYENLMHDRIAMEKEIAMSEREFAVETNQKKRDLALEKQKFEMETARKQADLEKGIAREGQDYQLQKQKLIEDNAFQTASKKFEIDRAFEDRAFGQKIQDEQQDFARQQSYKTQDLAKDLGRSGRDFNNRLSDMQISGASGVDYLRASRDQRNAVADKVQDFQIEQSRAGQELGIKQGREGRDFGQAKEKTLKERQLDVEQHYYDLRYQSIELETKHSRALEDSTLALERFKEDTALGRQELANKQTDFETGTGMKREKMDFDQGERRRGQQQKEFDFGGGLVNKLPQEALQKLIKSNPDIGKMVEGDLGRKGMTIPGLNAPTAKAKPSMFGKAGAAFGNMITDNVGDTFGLLKTLGPAALPLLPLIGAKNGAKEIAKMLGVDLPGFADGGFFLGQKPGPAILHPGELILNPDQQKALFSPMSNPQPVAMAGASGSGGDSAASIQNTFSLDGATNLPPEFAKAIAEIMKFSNAQMSNAKSQMMSANMRAQYQTFFGGSR